MKIKFNLFLSFITLTLFTTAQVSITQSNFPRQASFTDTFIVGSTSGLNSPTHGSGQNWNYSGAHSSTISTNTYMDASGNSGFPNALTYYVKNLTFQSFPINSNEYEAIDNNNWILMGRSIEDVTYSIATVTGGANDSLRFVGGNYIYPGLQKVLSFPVTYGKEWTSEYKEETDFQLTVAAFGLNKTPGKNVRYFTQVREVVGEGKLIIADYDGKASMPIDALLIKAVRSTVDSIFLGGMPAPTPLMQAFGLSQGSTFADSFYIFYTSGFGAPIMNINLGAGGQLSGVVYRPSAARLGNSSTSVFSVNHATLKGFPNPVIAGGNFYLNTGQVHDARQVQLFNSFGQLVHETNLTNQNADGFVMPIPQHLSVGIYVLNIQDANGRYLGSKKIQINR